MRPNSKNLLTKGLLGVKKALALATKGMLDLLKKVIPIDDGGGSISGYLYNKIYRVYGKPGNKFELTYKIIAGKLSMFAKEIPINSRTARQLEAIWNLQGIMQSSLELEKSFIGRTKQTYKLEFDLNGKKQSKYNDELVMAGTKLINCANELEIAGQKQIKFSIDNILRGKRDITNILVACDLID